MADWAITRFLTYIALDGKHFETLIATLANSTRRSAEIEDVFSRIVQNLLAAVNGLELRFPAFKFPAIDHFLEFTANLIERCANNDRMAAMAVAGNVKRGPSTIIAVMNSGILALWFAVAREELRPGKTSEFMAALKADRPNPSAPVKHSELLRTVRKGGLLPFLAEGESTHRRRVWCRLFQTLLQNGQSP